MRLDLYLKLSRLVRRRAVAQAMCEAGRVFVNGKEAKPSKDVRPGDAIRLRLPSRTVEIKVLALPKKGISSAEDESYRVMEDVGRE